MLPGLQFSRTSLTVSGVGTISISVANQDPGIPHNLAVYSDSTATRPIAGAQANICAGPCSFVVSFSAPPPGTYFFRCDVHPVDMTGQLFVR